MAKLVASFGALFLYGSLGAASTGGDSHHGPADVSDPLDQAVIAEINADDRVNGLASTLPASRSEESRPFPMSGISPEERERREQVCERQLIDCQNRCNRRYKTSKDIRLCKDDCGDKNGECMKEIPN